ncbi:MAG: stalk domain-containing protein [Bacillota bacterium]|nr:stalk domain-containing protein [Bacillota bacterium]
MKKLFCLILLITLVFSLLTVAVYGEGNIKVTVDGRLLSTSSAPVNVGGRVLVPLRDIFNALGASVDWDGSTRTVTAVKSGTNIVLQIGSKSAKVDGISTELDVTAQIINQKTYVPVRFIAESLGAVVSWNSNNNTVAIISPDKVEFSDRTTFNSKFSLSGHVKGSNLVLVQAQKGSQVWSSFLVPSNGVISLNVYLPYGPGSYDLLVAMKNEPGTDRTGNYEYLEQFKTENKDTRDLTYLLPEDGIQSDSQEIIDLARQITKDCSGDYDKTKAIHDWIAQNIAYDVDQLLSGKITVYSSLDALHNKKAICQGYANLNAALHRAIGIKTKVVTGIAIQNDMGETWDNTTETTENHAWNEILIGSRWVIEDVTWDAGAVDSQTNRFQFSLSHKYFDPDPAVFANDHRASTSNTNE